MFNNFKALSISHKTAPIDIREKLALDEQQILNLYRYFQEYSEITDVLILSTCNRTEIYYAARVNLGEELIRLIGIQKGTGNIEEYFSYFEYFNNHNDAIRHLFRVAIGLEAQVVGDLQISNQVKRAYQMSSDENLAGPMLHRLLHTIFYTNKKVVQETSFRDGAASVSYAATELIEELTSHILEPKILIIGLGEIGADICKNLESQKQKQVFLANRTRETAEKFVEKCGFGLIDFRSIKENLDDFDIILSTVSGDHFKISYEDVKSLSIPGYKYFIDLAVPRSVDLAVDQLPGVVLYNIDNIKNKTTEALTKRIASIPAVQALVEQSIEDFNKWSKEKSISPTINRLKNALEKIRQDEIAKHLKKLGPDETKKVEAITKSMMQKIIKLPVLQLKAACKRGEANTLIDVLNDLFDLENQSDEIFKN
jgi:glutamyl-tRNA reductase